jgi:delta 1-pyrroline-5-carboxylate dehydrogenase
MDLDKDDLSALSIGLTADEVDRVHRLLHEWGTGPEDGFPVQLALLTRAQWRMAANLPRLMNDARKLIELHLAEYRRQTAVLVQDFGTTIDGKTEDFKTVLADNRETVNQASVSIRNMLWETAETAKQIRKTLDDGVSAWNRAKAEMDTASKKFQKACQELDDRITWRELRRDWLTLLSLIAIGIVAGVFIGMTIELNYH